ncbi:hypothetical protein BC628DRAFT_719504 [Trametes gibbosa]|nr:hypothetical protein BC628DRAFT_719504 [Trametes gibbosa]
MSAGDGGNEREPKRCRGSDRPRGEQALLQVPVELIRRLRIAGGGGPGTGRGLDRISRPERQHMAYGIEELTSGKSQDWTVGSAATSTVHAREASRSNRNRNRGGTRLHAHAWRASRHSVAYDRASRNTSARRPASEDERWPWSEDIDASVPVAKSRALRWSLRPASTSFIDAFVPMHAAKTRPCAPAYPSRAGIAYWNVLRTSRGAGWGD